MYSRNCNMKIIKNTNLELDQLLANAQKAKNNRQINDIITYSDLAEKKLQEINSNTWKQLANLNEAAEQWQQAQKNYEKLIEIYPRKTINYLKLSQIFKNQNKINEAVAICRKLFNLNPQQPFLFLKQYGNLLYQNKQYNQAIKIFNKAIEANPDDSALGAVYADLGDIFLEQNKWKKADENYKKAIEINDKIGSRVYLKITRTQKQFNKNEKIIDKSYKQWIENQFLINHKYKVIYSPIAKNGATLLKNMMVDIAGLRKDRQNTGLHMHDYIIEHKETFQLKDFSYLKNPEYFKFIVLRNPFKRIVSAYLDKFVKRYKPIDSNALPVIKNVYEHYSIKEDYSKSITFSQFVEYLHRIEDHEINAHWRPQYINYAHGLVKFDFVGQFENLNSVLNLLEEKLDINIKTDDAPEHKTKYSDYDVDRRFNDYYPEDLRQLESLPSDKNLYTPKLISMVRERYANDIAIYEQEFNVCLNKQY